jgi:hypothetical protein
LFIFTGAGKDQGTVMSIINAADAKIIETLRECDLMLEELEDLLQEELLAIYLMRKQNNQEPLLIFETAVRLLERKKNRSIKQEAILAYAKKKLKEVTTAGVEN